MSAPSSSGASRDGYGAALLNLANDPRVVVIEVDLGKSTKSCLFSEQYPERTISLGIAEQNMVIVAAGLASCGKIPFASTFAIFTERAFNKSEMASLGRALQPIFVAVMEESIQVQMEAVLNPLKIWPYTEPYLE